jgi:hypothetical protein
VYEQVLTWSTSMPRSAQQLFDVPVRQPITRGRPSGEVPAVLVLLPTAPSRTGYDRFRSSSSPVPPLPIGLAPLR